MKAAMAGFAWRTRAVSAHPSRGSWPHRELHRRPRWQGSHGGPGLLGIPSRGSRGPLGRP
eukprot:2222967-Pyramimonas_sp.AAC.1